MNSLTSRCGAALLCASALAACGGSDSGSLPVSGTIYGLNRAGLILTTNGEELTVADSAGSFAFTKLLSPDTEFFVEVKKSPDGQKCTPTNNKNKINYYTYNSTIINCTTDSYPLGGSVSGLTGSGLVLANGSSTVAILPGATSFVFTTLVPNRGPYTVTVLTPPDGQTCTVTNGVATQMPMAAVNNVVVTCNKKSGA